MHNDYRKSQLIFLARDCIVKIMDLLVVAVVMQTCRIRSFIFVMFTWKTPQLTHIQAAKIAVKKSPHKNTN